MKETRTRAFPGEDTIPTPEGWPPDAELVSTLEERLATAIEDAENDAAEPLSPAALARHAIVELGLDPDGWVLVRPLGDRPAYASASRSGA